ncbi:MAG: O-antigen ligase family protein [Azonexus sp.]
MVFASGLRTTSSTPLFLIAMVVVALFFGLLAAVLPWWIVVAFLLLPMLIGIAVLFPEYGLIILILMISGLVPEGLMPSINVGPGKVLGTDLAIFGLAVVALVKASSLPGYLDSRWLYLRPVLLFMLLTISGMIIGNKFYGSPIKDVFTEARSQVHWLIAFIVIYLTTDRIRLNRVIWGLVVVGVAVASAVVVQFLTGISIIQNARVEDLVSGATHYQDITRSTAGGAIYLILLPMFYLIARVLTGSINLIFPVFLLPVLAAGVVVSFGRAIWITAAIGSLGLAFLLKGSKGLAQISVILVIGVGAALVGLSIAKPQVIEAAYERVVSTAGEGAKNSSLGWRFEEANFAINKILSSPIAGIGFGTAYKPRLDPMADWSQVRYIHNSYLGLWMKLGILGLFSAILAIYIVVTKAYCLYKSTNEPEYRSLAATLLIAFIVPVLTSFTQPEWLVSTGISFFAIVIGLLVSVDKHISMKAVR